MDLSVLSGGFARASQPVAVGHSILDAASLGAAIAAHWPVEPLRRIELLQHGQNDWYRLVTANRCYAVRVLKSGVRTPDQLRAELTWTRSLASAGIPTPAALSTTAGGSGIEIAAPEGDRLVCVYPWVEGWTLGRDLSLDDARAAGRLLASIHLSEPGLPAASRRHSLRDKLAQTTVALDTALVDDHERDLIVQLRAAIAAALSAEASLPAGSLHGDLHFGNLRRDSGGALQILDFDDCGLGALSVDLTPFLWRNRSEGLDPALDLAFLASYEQFRVLTAAERELLPPLLAARALYLAGVLARDRNKLGSVPGFDQPWPHYLQLAEDFLSFDIAPDVRE